MLFYQNFLMSSKIFFNGTLLEAASPHHNKQMKIRKRLESGPSFRLGMWDGFYLGKQHHSFLATGGAENRI